MRAVRRDRAHGGERPAGPMGDWRFFRLAPVILILELGEQLMEERSTRAFRSSIHDSPSSCTVNFFIAAFSFRTSLQLLASMQTESKLSGNTLWPVFSLDSPIQTSVFLVRRAVWNWSGLPSP